MAWLQRQRTSMGGSISQANRASVSAAFYRYLTTSGIRVQLLVFSSRHQATTGHSTFTDNGWNASRRTMKKTNGNTHALSWSLVSRQQAQKDQSALCSTSQVTLKATQLVMCLRRTHLCKTYLSLSCTVRQTCSSEFTPINLLMAGPWSSQKF